MIDRRDMIVAGAGLVGAGAAYALTPRKYLSLMKEDKLAAVVPESFGAWRQQDDNGLVRPKLEGDLTAKLYGETLAKNYYNVDADAGIMLLIAYGSKQSDLLQLHRPESCYPAFGFEIRNNQPIQLQMAPDVAVPARRLTAHSVGRTEWITYWTRLGDYLPTSQAEQRKDRFRLALQGYLGDGVLVRGSTVHGDKSSADRLVASFFRDLIEAISPAKRAALIGTERATMLSRISRPA